MMLRVSRQLTTSCCDPQKQAIEAPSNIQANTSTREPDAMTIVPIYAALLALLFVLLSVRTIRTRRRQGVALGHGDDPAMLRVMRVHANFAEYVPPRAAAHLFCRSLRPHALASPSAGGHPVVCPPLPRLWHEPHAGKFPL